MTSPLTSPLTSPALPGLLVVVGLLQRLGRLGLDRRLDGRDERLLVERARLLRIHRVGLGGLRLAGDVVARRRAAASWASFAFDAAGGCARFAGANPLTFPFTWLNAGSSAGSLRRRAPAAAAACRRVRPRRGDPAVGAAGAAAGPASPPVAGPRPWASRPRPCPVGGPAARASAAARASSRRPRSARTRSW